MVNVESDVPFGRAIYEWLAANHLKAEKLTHDDRLEEHYLAWETVRKETNPFFLNGTGFEGYLIGRCLVTEAALEAILAISQNILDAIARLYRFEYNLRARLMKTLLREMYDSKALRLWSAYLGAELGRQRAQIIGNRAAQAFQKQTYKVIRLLPPMVYHTTTDNVTQTYAVAARSEAHLSRLYVSAHMLKPCQQDAWLVAENIGEFGHPLVRTILDRI